MEREDEIRTTLLPGPDRDVGLKSTWGMGHHMFMFAGDPVNPDGEDQMSTQEPINIYEVRWDTDMHDRVARKLVNESHNIFMKLQSQKPPGESSTRNPQMVKVSREYRSVLKACTMELQSLISQCQHEEEGERLKDQLAMLEMMELIWSLCEALFVETLPGGVLLSQLLDWLKFHFIEGDHMAQEALKEEAPDTHPDYWDAIYSFVLQGRIDEARQMLSVHRSHKTDIFRSIEEVLRKMPLFSVFTGQSVAEFEMRWRHWQEDCHLRLEDGEFASRKELENICRILVGDNDVFSDLKDLCQTWYHMMISKLLYQNPTVKSFDLQYHTQDCIDVYGGNIHLQPYDNILLAAIEFDINHVIKESSCTFSNWWFVSHLSDLLQHCGKLESQTLYFGSNLREFLLLEYAASLMSHSSLWQIGAEYLDHCPQFGRSHLEQYIEHISLESERKAEKVLRVCEKRKMKDQVRSICKVMGMRSLLNSRLGSALSWGLRSKDVGFVTYISEKFLSEYSESGDFSNLDLIDNLGPSMLLSSKLTFLGKYREFHKLYEDGDFRAAASLLLSLLTSRLAPKRFWVTLLTDALPLLEADEIIFSSQQTYELMHCLEELNLAQRIEEKTQKAQGDVPMKNLNEAEGTKLELMKLALARNLARAIVCEGSTTV